MASSLPSASTPRPDPSGDLQAAVDCVRAGGVLVYPTATVYGIGGDATSEAVAERVRRLKGREGDKPMLVLTDEWTRVEPWITGLTEVHTRLMTHSISETLTLLFVATDAAPVQLRGSSPYIGIRRTRYPFCRALIEQADVPLVSTSANRAGDPPAYRFADVDPALLHAADVAVDAGDALPGTPSTVVVVENGRVMVVREGAVSAERLLAVARGDG